ncbi:TTN [Mytilus edulis]|uniref:TTN n=1 Tax=Mytilus edulis TaxID=6550 RepID=A0A8S3PUY9_MYTED|nr:TTN [Mytilus edulis]
MYLNRLFFLKDAPSVEYIEGEDATLTCEVSPTNLPVEWFKEGNAVKLDVNCSKTNEGTTHNLIIRNVNRDNSGEYCVRVGNFSRTLKLIIKDCFLKDAPSVEYIEGEDAKLTCEVSPTNLPVEWFKEGNAVKLDVNCSKTNEGTTHNLIIRNVNRDNSGEYCVRVGNFSRTLKLIIKDCFLKDAPSVEYIEGEDAKLTCEVSPTNLPVEWFKEGNAVKLDENCSKTNEGTTHNLIIRNVNIDNSGEYYCFLKDAPSVEYIEGEDAKLTCEVSPTNLPVEWFKEGNAVKLDENCSKTNEGTTHNLIIRNVNIDNSGEYCVRVGNFCRTLKLIIKEWFKEGNAVKLDVNCSKTNEGTTHNLIIRNVNRDNSGEYCVRVGNFSRTLKLIIKDCFLKDAPSVEYIEGEDAKLTCEVSPTNLPVEWFKEGNAVKLDVNCSKTNEGTTHNLIIRNVNRDNSGEYCVRVGNFSRTLKLIIKGI